MEDDYSTFDGLNMASEHSADAALAVLGAVWIYLRQTQFLSWKELLTSTRQTAGKQA